MVAFRSTEFFRAPTKRVIDVAVSVAALILLSPVFVLIGLAVWIDSGLPVFYAQTRVGRGLRPLIIRKFRTMRPSTGLLVTTVDDSRVTRVGAVLRRTKLDELPTVLERAAR